MTVRYHQAAEVGSSRMVAVTPTVVDLQLCSRQSPASSVVVVVALCCNQSIKHYYLVSGRSCDCEQFVCVCVCGCILMFYGVHGSSSSSGSKETKIATHN